MCRREGATSECALSCGKFTLKKEKAVTRQKADLEQSIQSARQMRGTVRMCLRMQIVLANGLAQAHGD